jgi:hypothetical protein
MRFFMRRSAIRLLTLAGYAAAVAMVPVVIAGEGEASSRHHRKHHRPMYPGWYDPWAAERIRPVVPQYPGPVCPGNARGIDCKVWPPPMDEDPDRKQSGADSG